MRWTAEHEAAHAASLLLDGLPPLVARVDWPEPLVLGHVIGDWFHHPLSGTNLVKWLIALCQGPLAEGKAAGDLAAWPIRPQDWGDGNHSDAENAALIGHYMEIDADHWHGIVAKAIERSRDVRFRALTTSIGWQLEQREILLQHELVEIAGNMGVRC